MGRPDKTTYYLDIARAVCERSPCLRRKYGAVIVKNDELIATGYNGPPRGYPNCCDTGICKRTGHEHNDGDYATSCNSVHAEMNAIISASRRDMIGSTLYLYGEEDGKPIKAVPCPICQRLIMNAGIDSVIGSEGFYWDVKAEYFENVYMMANSIPPVKSDWGEHPDAPEGIVLVPASKLSINKKKGGRKGE